MKKKYFILSGLICLSCNNVATNVARVNPTPVPATPTPQESKFVPPSGTLSDDLPNPSKTPEVKLDELTFDVRIEFDGILGRVIVNDGELRTTPADYKLKGGNAKIEVLDLITKCRIVNTYLIDKNQTIDLRKKCSSPGNS